MCLQALFSTENAETEVKTWAADTDYLIKVTSAVEMDLLVGVNGGATVRLHQVFSI